MPPLPAFHKFTHPPPQTNLSVLTFPAPHILLVTLSRPKALNCINSAGHHELHAVWNWLDSEPELRVGIITGEGRAFCAGADLKGCPNLPPRSIHTPMADRFSPIEWSTTASSSSSRAPLPPSGFGGLSRRVGKKPVIAAVNGICFGGGCEMVVNCDIVLAAPSARIGLPEVKRGVVALAGALPRLSRIVGRMRAMEMALTGREISAGEAREWGFCNGVAERDGWGEMKGGVVDMAVGG